MMAEIVWGPWRSSGMPALGDYIQVRWVFVSDGERGVSEGWVAGIEGSIIMLSPVTPKRPLEWPIAVRYRQGAFPEHNSREHVLEGAA